MIRMPASIIAEQRHQHDHRSCQGGASRSPLSAERRHQQRERQTEFPNAVINPNRYTHAPPVLHPISERFPS